MPTTASKGDPESSSSRRESMFFRRRFSNASLLTIGSTNTVLPQYSAVGNAQNQDDGADGLLRTGELYYASPPPSGGIPCSQLGTPSLFSVVNPRHSTLLAWTTSNSTAGANGRTRMDPCFQYSFPIQSNKHWATLHLTTPSTAIAGDPRPSYTQPKMPTFWGCDPITGVVHLDLDNPLTIQQINVALRGKLMTSSLEGETLQFMTHQVTLWKKPFGTPLQPDMNADSPTQKDGIFTGKSSFSFSFPFPTHFDPTTKLACLPPANGTSSHEPTMPTTTMSTLWSPTKKKKRFSWPVNFGSSGSDGTSKPPRTEDPSVVYPLPQTFTEKGISVVIIYEILVTFVHGRFKPDSRIKSQITYTPASQSFPASQKRRQAYEAGALIPGPIADADGWFELPTASIRGIIDVDGERRLAVIDCTVHLAQPLSYTRGGVIPCFITLSNDDVEALSCLASPKAPVVRLMRCLRHFVPNVYGGHIYDLKTVIHEMATATWWIPSKDVPQQENLRHLEGEIHLEVDFQPSCASKIFNVEYTVELYTLQSAYFEVESDIGKGKDTGIAVASVPVEITTLYRQDEPVPIPHTERPRPSIRRVPSHDTVWEQAGNV